MSNGNYVVLSPDWDNGAVFDAGAVDVGEWHSRHQRRRLGRPTAWSAARRAIGSGLGVTALSNGNYVVSSTFWHNGGVAEAGAVTWGNGTAGVSGVVSAANSLVGDTTGDQVGLDMTVLSNGNYVVNSPDWDNGAAGDAGAVTWGNGATGVSGVVSAANSLVGSTAGDRVGSSSVTALSNGNYVVCSTSWDKGAVVDAGAVTWGERRHRCQRRGVGDQQPGRQHSRRPGRVCRRIWRAWRGTAEQRQLCGTQRLVGQRCLGAENAGAVTWGSGTAGVRGVVSAANSLVGSTTSDRVGCQDPYCNAGLTVLSNGNYVVGSQSWDNGATANVGAVTWGSGTTGVSGPVSAANSLVGSSAGDQVGCDSYYCGKGVVALRNGNYVVSSAFWDNGAAIQAGAVTWGNGTTGIAGEVSAANSLVGSSAEDWIGSDQNDSEVTVLSDGNYVVGSPYWDNGAAVNSGAVSWGDRSGGTAGPITAENSVRGTAVGGGGSMTWTYDHRYPISQLVVARPADNIVTLFRLPPIQAVFLPVVLKSAP